MRALLLAALLAAALPAHAQHRFAVAAAHPLAAEAGAQILRRGGSAVDAAIATQMVLGLVEPQSSGIGGGAFLLHWSAKERRLRGYDGRETAPAAAQPGRFLDSAGKPLEFRDAVASGLAVGVPGVLRLLEVAHRRHGRLSWRELFAPAIRLAEKGFPMSPRLHAALGRESGFAGTPYHGADGKPKPVGARVANADYAATLRAIAGRGADAFYRGPIASDIVRAVRAHPKPGDLSLEDLAAYRVIERAPVCAQYRASVVCSAALPAGGLTVLQLLGLLERSGFERAPPNSAHAAHLFAEAGRLAYADRERFLGDPDFTRIPAGLLERSYLDERARLIGARSMGRAEPGAPRLAPPRADGTPATSSGTSHVSIVDARGDVVSMTTTIESVFGSRILVRGFLLNNQLTDFSFVPVRDGREVANRVQAGKRPRSAMSPTIVMGEGGSPAIALGSPGGSAIINYVARALVAMLDWELDAQAAVALPNFGSRNGPTEIERGSVYEALIPELRARGHEPRPVELTSGLHALERVRGGWRGGADPRREGVVAGN